MSDSIFVTQAEADTLFYGQARNSRIGFNSFVFSNQGLGLFNTAKTSIRLATGQTYLYNKNLTGRGGRFVQEDYFFRIEQLFHTHKGLDLGYRGQWYAFRAIGNSFGRYEGVLRWQPVLSRVSLFTEGSAGIAADKRGPIQNIGPSYRLAAWGTALSKDSSTQYFWQGQSAQAFIAPRQMALWLGRVGLEQRVSTFGQTRLSAGYLRRRVEDYLSNQIQQIVSDSLEAALFLGFSLTRKVDFQSDNRLLIPTRRFNYLDYDSTKASIQNTRFRQTEVFSRQTLMLTASRIRQTVSVELTQRTRSYNLDNNLNLATGSVFDRALASEKVKDISEATVAYAYTGSWQINQRSSIRGSWNGSLLRVNTPSVLNDQDRDETFYTSDLAWSHRWKSTLRSNLRLSGSIRDVVFIKGTQSSQNYTERVIRLEPSISYALGRIRLTSHFGVWATYNVRQFSQEEGKNRANRIWIQTYQARYQANKSLYILTDFVRRENRIAQLNWTNFTESPIDTVIIKDLHIRGGKSIELQHSNSTLSTEIGYKLFRQDRHNLAGVSTPGKPTRQAALHTINRQHGPSAAFVWELPGRGRILLDGWLQWATTKYKYRTSEEIFVGQTFTSSQLDARDRRLFMFFNLTGQVLLR